MGLCRDAIEAVEWGAVPGHPDWYEPERAASGLRALARASNRVQAARAGALLGDGGIVHGHSAAVFPAAAVAAPLLLDIARRGSPAARDTALGLLDEALSCYPHAGYTRVATSLGAMVPVCCAIACQLRAHTEFLAGLGPIGRSLLADAAQHWRFEVRECVADEGGTVVSGTLAGRFPPGTCAAERYLAGTVTALAEVILEYPPSAACAEAYLRIPSVPPGELPPGATLFPAECGERVH